uniref:NAC domain-containing protein n=1 Tax=Oryza meridionalis TaxID=40149 RepID=A0A0E0BWP2_9ORYZ
MASSAHIAAVLNLPWGYRFRPSDRQIIANYLGPMALHGADSLPQRGDVVEGVDVFATRPAAIPFEPRRHVFGRDEVRAYFFGDQPTDSRGREVPGGAWLPCGGGGGDKAYSGGADGGEAVAYRRKYEFRAADEEADRAGEEAATPARPRWRMKEYRLNKSAAAFRRAYAQPNPKANMDCVVREIYTKAVPPPTPPSGRSGDEEMQEGSDYSVMDEDDDELVDYLLQDFEDGNFDEDQDQSAAAEDGDYSDEDQDQDQPAAAEDGDYSDEDQDQPAAAEDGDYSDEDEP